MSQPQGSEGQDEAQEPTFPPAIPTDRPTTARVYGLYLGSKDNFAIDRHAAVETLKVFPEFVDIARQNRRFLYRAVRYLAQELGIDQFLDLGSGLPAENNVHEVAQTFQPGAKVLYIDDDPIVLAHGRALLADDQSTTVVQADMTDPRAVLDAPETRQMIDFSRPVAVLLFGVPHCIGDDEVARRTCLDYLDHVASGSCLAVSAVVARDAKSREESTRLANELGAEWKTRAPEEYDAWLSGLELIAPGMVDVEDWRPDPEEPPLSEPHPDVRPWLGASGDDHPNFVHGGLLRKP